MEHKASSYLKHPTKEGEKPAEAGDDGNQEIMEKAKEAAAKEDQAAGSTNDRSSETTADAQASVGKVAQTYSDTTDAVKDGHRNVEDTVQSGIKDGVGSIQGATGTEEATSAVSEGLNDTADAAKSTTRDVEDTQQKTISGVGKGVGDMAKGATGENKAQDMGQGAKSTGGAVAGGLSDTAGGAMEGGKGAAAGVADTGKGVAGALGSGASKAGSALGGLTGWGGKK